MKNNDDNWTYLPMRNCVRTRVDLSAGLVEQTDIRASYNRDPDEPTWQALVPCDAHFEQAAIIEQTAIQNEA